MGFFEFVKHETFLQNMEKNINWTSDKVRADSCNGVCRYYSVTG
jgi:hypothetical protein